MADETKQIKVLLKVWGSYPGSKSAFMQWMNKQLGELTVNQFHALCKIHIEHMTVKQIAVHENVNTATVKTWVDSAYEKLTYN